MVRKKTLSERIIRRNTAQKPGRGAKNRAAFLAQKDEIKEALENGWSAKIIWQTLYEEGKIDCGYTAFLNYIKILIKEPEKKLRQEEGAEENASSSKSPKREKGSGFDFKAKPTKEDLI